ncbi:MAG: hypothetical protein ABSG04_02650 [Verrucomicrobiota bacterium]|jgi:hypothetical protein
MATTATVERPVEKLQDAEVRIVRNIRSALRQGAVEADPATAAPQNLIRLTEIAFCQEFPVAAADNRLVHAMARGITVRRKLMEAQGGSLSAEEAGRELGISKAAILKRYHKGRIMGWREERQNAVRFPVWQFKDHKVLEGLEEVLQVLNAASRLDDFGRMLFFLSDLGFLGKKRPVDCLRAGKVNKVLQAARGYGG